MVKSEFRCLTRRSTPDPTATLSPTIFRSFQSSVPPGHAPAVGPVNSRVRRHRILPNSGLSPLSIPVTRSSSNVAADEYRRLLEVLEYCSHELPAGILFGADGATPRECQELLDDLYAFEALTISLGIDKQAFVNSLRWHLERYPHYLSRRRHFKGYEDYILRHNGPLVVSP